MPFPLLTAIIFLPLIVAVGLLWVPRSWCRVFAYATLAVSVLQLIGGAWLYRQASLQPLPQGLWVSEKAEWFSISLGSLGQVSADYLVGLDGQNLTMFLLAMLVMAIGAVASFEIQQKQKAYFLLYLLLNASVMGCFAALDFLLFFLFFEFMLLPMYFLIGIWGGERREYAAIKFFIYTFVGSIFILVAMIALFLSVNAPEGGHSFNMLLMTDPAHFAADSLLHPEAGALFWGKNARFWVFLLLFIGFTIKLPMVPLHTWLPDAHVEAPTPISVVLAGILLKIGGYGLMRTAYSIFPEVASAMAMVVACLGVFTMLYAGMVALGQTQLKKMIAYSSVSHMGFVLLGLAAATPEAVNGVVFQMFSHGLLASMLFLCAGVVYARTHLLDIALYRGLLSVMPRYGAFVGIAFFASLGLPGFSAFIAEILVFIGAFASPKLPLWLSASATLVLLIGAAYYLWTFQRMFLGKFQVLPPIESNQLTDLQPRELMLLAFLAVMALLLGIFPNLVLGLSEAYVTQWVKVFN
jgi:NADH-quinone oxidoreductase subunit M